MNTEASSQTSKKVHHGRNVKRLREILDIKQDTLAEKIGVSQQTISRVESEAKVDDEMLDKIAKELNISVDAIKNYNDDSAVNFISNTFTSNEQSVAVAVTYQPNFNPIDKIMQLYEDKIALYERLLKAEQDKNAMLEKRLEK